MNKGWINMSVKKQEGVDNKDVLIAASCEVLGHLQSFAPGLIFLSQSWHKLPPITAPIPDQCHPTELGQFMNYLLIQQKLGQLLWQNTKEPIYSK